MSAIDPSTSASWHGLSEPDRPPNETDAVIVGVPFDGGVGGPNGAARPRSPARRPSDGSKRRTRPRSLDPVMVLVFDFDGVFTDARSDPSFVGRFQAELHRMLGEEIALEEWEHAFAEVRSDPSRHGWWRSGRVVASACDVFLLCQAAARHLLARRQLEDAAIEPMLAAGFRAGWAASSLHFRHDAGALARAIEPRQAFVVTNSNAERVSSRLLENAIPIPRERVFGEARKDAVDPTRALDGSAYGLGRPIYGERPEYARALKEIAATAGVGLSQVTVIGDNTELDLVQPRLLGAEVVLIEHEMTYDWERKWLQSPGPRARSVRSLSDLAALLTEGPRAR